MWCESPWIHLFAYFMVFLSLNVSFPRWEKLAVIISFSKLSAPFSLSSSGTSIIYKLVHLMMCLTSSLSYHHSFHSSSLLLWWDKFHWSFFPLDLVSLLLNHLYWIFHLDIIFFSCVRYALYFFYTLLGFCGGSAGKNLSAMRETWIQSLG